MNDIVFVTSNDNKVREAEDILGFQLERENVDLDEIQEMDLAKIIEHKTRQAYEKLHKPIIAEDVGLYIDAWNGFPGPFIKWLLKTMGCDIFPKLLPDDNRKVKWVVMYGYYDGKDYRVFEGVINGEIAPELRGNDGWGFDPLFIPEGQTQTFAEMGPQQKYKFSARQRALLVLRDFLQSRGTAAKHE